MELLPGDGVDVGSVLEVVARFVLAESDHSDCVLFQVLLHKLLIADLLRWLAHVEVGVEHSAAQHAEPKKFGAWSSVPRHATEHTEAVLPAALLFVGGRFGRLCGAGASLVCLVVSKLLCPCRFLLFLCLFICWL